MVLETVPFLFAVLTAGSPTGLADKGVFSSLDAGVALALPAWVSHQHLALAVDRSHRVLTVSIDREPVKAYPMAPTCATDSLECLGLRDADRKEVEAMLKGAEATTFAPPDFADTDGDGIADSVDILLGAKKTVLLHSAYRSTAPKLAYPGGDVPSDVGVCTDVIVRALRNAGIDLQKAIFEDAGSAPQAYPAISGRNPSLDHRRVRNLAVYFKRHWRAVQRLEDLLPGDVVLLDTFPSKPGPDHIGIVSDTLGQRGLPLIINAWTDGFHTEEMDLLPSIPMTIAYRAPTKRRTETARSPGEGPALTLPPSTRQLVLVVTDGWSDPHARLSRWEKDPQGWHRRGPVTTAMIGAAGLGWGRGLHGDVVAGTLGGPSKREGDDRAPAGIFRLPLVTGYAHAGPAGTKLPYRQATDALRCVDDPASPDYNQLRTLGSQSPSWRSDEKMRRGDDQYRLTVVVEHNRSPVRSGAGSCIFLHTWPAPQVPSPGCTMMAAADVEKIVTWLDPHADPVLVQLPMTIAERVAQAWGLPARVR